MNVLRPLALLLVLAACGGPKDVSPAALSAVPASSVGRLAELESAIDDAQVEHRRAVERVESLEGQLKSARAAVDEADVSFEKTRTAKADAVRSGNAQAAAGLEADLKASQDRLDARRKLVADLETQLDTAEKAVALRKAEVAWRDAALELARAEAADGGGADVDVEDYRKAEKAEKARYDEALAATEAG